MKILILLSIIILLNISSSYAGNEGGGGHTCKSQAFQYFENTVNVINRNSEILQKYPEWAELQFVLNPEKNPGFKIEITSSPIQDCPYTQNALACGRPSQNKIQIYCGTDGWNTLETAEKYKQVIHEIYWWSKLDDTNYFYSNKFANNVFDLLKNNELKSGIYRSMEAPGCEFIIEATQGQISIVPYNKPHEYCRFELNRDSSAADMNHNLVNRNIKLTCQDDKNCHKERESLSFDTYGPRTIRRYYEFSSQNFFNEVNLEGKVTVTDNYAHTEEHFYTNYTLYFWSENRQPFTFYASSESKDARVSQETNCHIAKNEALLSVLEQCRRYFPVCEETKIDYKKTEQGVVCAATVFYTGTPN